MSFIAAKSIFCCAHFSTLNKSIQRFNESRQRSEILPPGIPRYWVNVCDWYPVSLESCPTCGYALSIVNHHCRHCATAPPAIPSRATKHLQQIIVPVVVALSVLVYLIFFR
jgi:hypothetical protein